MIDMKRDAVSTECGHQFHLTCLIENMTSSSSNRQNCPLCREAMLQGYSICSDHVTAQRMIQVVLQNNQALQVEIDSSERLQDTLLWRLQEIDSLRNRVAQQRAAIMHDALELLDRNAMASNLYSRISSVVASAANNDIRENYYEVHESLEDTIRAICFDFALLSLSTPVPAVELEPVNGHRNFPIIVD